MGYKHDYDKALTRLTTILSRLYQGEELSVTELAQEFNVSTRTVQRDFNNHLIQFPIEQVKKRWRFREGCTIEKGLSVDELIVTQIIEKMSENIGGEFFTKTERLLSRIRNNEFNPIYTRIDMEDISGHLSQIALIEQAIKERRYITAIYDNDDKTHSINVKPLKMANFEGFWYLIAMEDGVEYVKKYYLKNLSLIVLMDETFNRSLKLDEALENAMGIWFRIHQEPFEVRLALSPQIAKYFKRKSISKTQIITHVGSDGSMEIVLRITHEMEIVPIVQYWMPHMKVIKPEWIHEKIMDNIKGYT